MQRFFPLLYWIGLAITLAGFGLRFWVGWLRAGTAVALLGLALLLAARVANAAGRSARRGASGPGKH